MFGGVILVLLNLDSSNFKNIIGITLISVFVGFIIVINTGVIELFQERYEMRNLDERDLAEEKRFIEYELLYNDMFVHYDYSPLIGYQLFNSGGNYGKGILESRTLHSDITSIIHSSGFIGLLFYIMMVSTAFYQSFCSQTSKMDFFVLIFCLANFIFYTVTGRYTNIGSHLIIYLLLSISLARNSLEGPLSKVEYPIKEVEQIKV